MAVRQMSIIAHTTSDSKNCMASIGTYNRKSRQRFGENGDIKLNEAVVSMTLLVSQEATSRQTMPVRQQIMKNTFKLNTTAKLGPHPIPQRLDVGDRVVTLMMLK
jgi:hypothetical protein